MILLHCIVQIIIRIQGNFFLQLVKIKGKHVKETWGSEIEVKTVDPNEVMYLHRSTGEALSHTMDDQGKESSQLKHKIYELEVNLSPRSLFARPLTIVQPMEDSLSHSRKIEKITWLLAGFRAFVANNIKGRIDIIFEDYEVLENVRIIVISLHSFKEHLVAGVKNDE